MKANSVKQNPLTTIAGILIVAIIPLLAFFGIIHPQDVNSTQQYIGQVFSAIISHAWLFLVTAIGGLTLIFVGYDSINWRDIWNNIIKSPKTTIIGIGCVAVIPILVYFGVINPDTAEPLKGYWTQLIESYSTHTWEGVITAVLGIISIFFSKDKA